MRPFAVLRVLILLALCQPCLAQDDNVVNSATITVENIVIEQGTPTARIPITISSDNEGQRISGIMLTVMVGPEDEKVQIVDIEKAHDESLWNEHPKTIQIANLLDKNVASLLQITWFEPEDQISIPCDGTVAILTVDSSKFVVGEYRITTNHMGRTSASVMLPGNLYYPVNLEHDNGILKVVPRRGGNLNQ